MENQKAHIRKNYLLEEVTPEDFKAGAIISLTQISGKQQGLLLSIGNTLVGTLTEDIKISDAVRLEEYKLLAVSETVKKLEVAEDKKTLVIKTRHSVFEAKFVKESIFRENAGLRPHKDPDEEEMQKHSEEEVLVS